MLLRLRLQRDGRTRGHRKRDAMLVLLAIDRGRDAPPVQLLELPAVAHDAPGDGDDEVKGDNHDDDSGNEPAAEGRGTRIEVKRASC